MGPPSNVFLIFNRLVSENKQSRREWIEAHHLRFSCVGLKSHSNRFFFHQIYIILYVWVPFKRKQDQGQCSRRSSCYRSIPDVNAISRYLCLCIKWHATKWYYSLRMLFRVVENFKNFLKWLHDNLMIISLELLIDSPTD